MDRLRPAVRAPALRAWLERKDRGVAARALERWLETLDPESARTVELRNRRRVLRALEVTLATGQPFSRAGRQREPSLPSVWIGLRRPRPALHQRVEQRVHAMLAQGWLEEVRTLHAMGYAPDLPSLSATGYRELGQVLPG